MDAAHPDRLRDQRDAWSTTTLAALDARRKSHEMGAVFGGRLAAHGRVRGRRIHRDARRPPASSSSALTPPRSWRSCGNVYLPDVDKIALRYGDYFQIGTGAESPRVRCFEEDATGRQVAAARPAGGWIPHSLPG